MSEQENLPTAKRTTSAWRVDEKLQEAVDKYIAEDPARYKAAQEFGDFLVNHPQFSQLDNFKVDQKDMVGDEILYQEIGAPSIFIIGGRGYPHIACCR